MKYVMALEEGIWSVDREPVEVEPGTIVLFQNDEDADYFCQPGTKSRPQRGEVVASTPEQLDQFLADMAETARVEQEKRASGLVPADPNAVDPDAGEGEAGEPDGEGEGDAEVAGGEAPAVVANQPPAPAKPGKSASKRR